MTGGPSRRAILRGLGASVALPWLPSLARAEVAPPVHRHLFWYIPVGMLPDAFVPTTTGLDWTPSPVLAPLARHRQRMTVVSGLDSLDGDAYLPVDPHEIFAAAAFTGEYLAVDRVEGPHGGRSVDQLLADTLAGDTAFRSLELASDEGFPCLAQLNCLYLQNVSWQDRHTPRSRESSLRKVFERLFGTADTLADAEAQQRRVARSQSVLDFVKDAATRVEARLGSEDRVRLEDWLDGVREVERRLALPPSDARCGEASAPLAEALAAAELGNQAHIEAMHALMGLALACDRTRVITYMPSNERSLRVYSDLGHVDSHHFLSHHTGLAWKKQATQQAEVWLFERLAHLIDELAARPDPAGGSLLDHTTVVAMGGMGEPQWHLRYDLPVVLFGGRDQTGRHLRYAGRPHADLLLTLLRRAGRQDERFGQEGQAVLAELA
ncbi:MAG: DUF1552 domain-containing protein [Alphaproteobacteria bacterium]|nr:DUF1552 domain-containing protein [Alphaproteobacteria bacterium]